MKKVLVTGGMGYIGSHIMLELTKRGYSTFSLDNMVNSSELIKTQIEKLIDNKCENFKVSILDEGKLESIFEEYQFDYVIHLAAFKSIPESIRNPIAYYDNNITGLINVLNMCRKYEVSRFVFSSSCSVYGEHIISPVDETTGVAAHQLSPYSLTKKIGEELVADFALRTGIECVNLRYFNPAGADSSGLLGELPKAESPVIPSLIRRAARGESFQLYGDDYGTRDGSCVRDFVHVSDLAIGHISSIEYGQEEVFETFNLGSGQGITVLEVIRALQVIFPDTRLETLGRRAGDIPAIYSNNQKARQKLGWDPKLGISEMLHSEVCWQATLRSLTVLSD